jgi:hypothetical protein
MSHIEALIYFSTDSDDWNYNEVWVNPDLDPYNDNNNDNNNLLADGSHNGLK